MNGSLLQSGLRKAENDFKISHHYHSCRITTCSDTNKLKKKLNRGPPVNQIFWGVTECDNT